ncbi:TSCPD domain-containing protein [Pseudobutyrivibrio sp.]
MPILKSEGNKEADIHEVGKIRKLTTGCGSLHLTAFFNSDTGDLMEIFLNKGSSGGCNNFMIGLSRIVSLAAKQGCTIYEIIDQLQSCGVCPSYATRSAMKKDTSPGSCCPVAVGKALMEMWEEMQDDLRNKNDGMGEKRVAKKVPVDAKVGTQKDVCPLCKSKIKHSGGCDICTNCGWSKCD